MGLFDIFRSKKPDTSVQNADSGLLTLTDVERWFGTFGGGASGSGVYVTPDSAMRFSAVFACVRLIGGVIASAPIKIYSRERDGGRSLAFNHRLSELMRIRPNQYMTSSTFWKWMTQSKLLQGNAYANIIRTRSGMPVALYPMDPRKVDVYYAWELGLDKIDGINKNRLFYRLTFEDGNQSLFDQDDMLHIPNVGFDGKRGISTVTAAAQGIGLGIAAEQSSASFYKNGMQSNMSISYDGTLSESAKADLKDYIAERYSGVGNHYKPLILQGGGKATTLSMSAEDAQLIESRQFSVIDIARFFGVPPIMIGESEKTSSWGSGVEQITRGFATYTLNEHFTAFEQELEVKLFRGDGYFAEFDEDELTRGDTKTQGEFFRVARGSMQEPGFMTINEIRSLRGLPPVAGGDELMRPETTTGGTDAPQ